MAIVSQLKLVPTKSSRPIVAGFFPGSDTFAWLAEMAKHPGATFYPVPTSREDLDPGGLLILLPHRQEPNFGPRVIPCALHFGKIAATDGWRVDPVLTESEVDRLLPYAAYFFHPTIGLIAFESGDAIEPASLIVPPLLTQSNWMGATLGSSALPRLKEVALILPEEPGEMFGDAASEIGTKPPKDLQDDASALDKLKDKLKTGAAIGGMGALGGLAAGLQGLSALGNALGGNGSSGNSGHQPQGESWLDQAQQWTKEQLEKLQRQRESEINRLMKLLETNPEEGLKYALPFGGDAARGQAPPGSRLGPRNPFFGSRSGSGPADVWDLAPNTQWELQQKYRDLANKELATGNYDRAAYIFAELLGDWHAAANALVQGSRFQEAAKLYIDKLNNKQLAAKCLEDGGVLSEAIVIYAELNEHEKCGDLFRKLGREDEAKSAYREALRGEKDRIHDARIYFEKLNETDRALKLLASGWPYSPQAQPCLEKQFNYLQQLDNDEEALCLAEKLSLPTHRHASNVTMTETLAKILTATRYPAVKESLSTLGIQIIGEALTSSQVHQPRLLQLLPDFAPSDPVLRRDSSRYRSSQNKGEQRIPNSTGHADLKKTTSIRLPNALANWIHLDSDGEFWIAASLKPNIKALWVAGSKKRILGSVTFPWNRPVAELPTPSVLWTPEGRAWLPVRIQDQLKHLCLGEADFTASLSDGALIGKQPFWLPKSLHATYPTGSSVWVLHSSAETLDLSCYTLDGQLLRQHALGWTPPSLLGSILAVQGADAVVSHEHFLVQIRHGEVINSIEMDSPVHQIKASPPTHVPYFLVSTQSTVTFIRFGKAGESIQLFHNELERPPVSTILGDGRLVVGNKLGLMVYSMYPKVKSIQAISKFDGTGEIVALAPWGDTGLIVLWSDGLMDFYE